MSSDLKWEFKEVKIADLFPNKDNPRKITNIKIKELRKSISELGFFKPIVCDFDLTILGGNQRQKALLQDFNKDQTITISIPNRKLTEEEKQKVVLQDNIHQGEWDYEVLKLNFDSELLLSLGDTDIISNIEQDGSEKNDDYIRKIESPIYTPKGTPKKPNELYDLNKANELIGKIQKAELKNDVKQFLINAAYRHVRFNYSDIAEYYCHANKEIQSLMEDSALVIIDFNKAIEQGFVEMSNSIASSFENTEDDNE